MPPPSGSVTKQSRTAWTPRIGATVDNVVPVWTELYSGALGAAPNAAVLASDGAMIQAWNDGGAIKTRRVASPSTAANWTGSWTSTASGKGNRPVALSRSGTNHFLFYIDESGGQERVRVRLSTDAGATWGAGATIHTATAGYVLGGLGATSTRVVLAENQASVYRHGIAVFSAGTWGAVTFSSADNGSCNGLDVENVDGDYLVLFNHRSNDNVDRIKRRVYDGSWGTITTQWENYFADGQSLLYPSYAVDGDTGFMYGVFIREDTRDGGTANRIYLSFSEGGTYWLEPLEILEQDHGFQLNVVFSAATDAYWLVSHNYAWYWGGATSTVLDEDVIAYTAVLGPLGPLPGMGGNEIELWLDNRDGAYIDDSILKVGARVTINRWYADGTVGSQDLVGYIAALRRFGVDRQSAKVRVLLMDPIRYDREAPTRLTFTGQTAEVLLRELVARADFGGAVTVDGASVWSQVVTEFVVRRNETWRSAIVRLLGLVGARGYLSGGSLFAVAETTRTTEYVYGPNDHPLLPGSWIEERLSPTVHEARGSGGIYGVAQDWDRVEVYGGYLASTLDTYIDDQTGVDALADRKMRGNTREGIAGRVVAAPNIYALPLDWVEVSDALAGISQVVYSIEQIREEWDSHKKLWRQTIDLGGILA